jgi:hypothetical protein
VTTPNVLAHRYASPQVARIWSPEHKIVLERRLWIAVLKAQRDLGVETPDGVIESYESVVDRVDLASIAAREKVTRHDVKARIEEFAALAGTEHIHKGMTSRDLTENVEQLQLKASLELMRDRAVATLARLGRLATEHAELVMAGRSHNVAAQATTLGKRFATVADELMVAIDRLDDLIARYPLRGIKGPVGTSQDQLDLLGGDETRLREGADERGPGLSALAGLRRRHGPRPARRRTVQPRHDDPAHGRQRDRDRGLPSRSGRLQRDAAQDEHAIVRAGQRPRGRPARVRLDDRRARRRPVERG